ncbi:MAG: tetratricopeptide repeat protein [Phycisphaerae bacterium]
MVRRRLVEAESICRDAMAMRSKLLGPEAIDTLASRGLLARILLARGQSQDAAREADARVSDMPTDVIAPAISTTATPVHASRRRLSMTALRSTYQPEELRASTGLPVR